MGVGTSMIAKLEEWANEMSMSSLSLSVFDGNKGAKKLYERLGFKYQNTDRIQEMIKMVHA